MPISRQPGAVIDPQPYYAVCAGVRRLGTLAKVTAWARQEVEAWLTLGYRRSAKVFYRDGSLVEEIREPAEPAAL